MNLLTDQSGNQYNEIPINGGNIRLTYIAKGWDDSPSLRIQIRDNRGHLRQGPEIPLKNLGDLYSGSLNLLINCIR